MYGFYLFIRFFYFRPSVASARPSINGTFGFRVLTRGTAGALRRKRPEKNYDAPLKAAAAGFSKSSRRKHDETTCTLVVRHAVFSTRSADDDGVESRSIDSSAAHCTRSRRRHTSLSNVVVISDGNARPLQYSIPRSVTPMSIGFGWSDGSHLGSKLYSCKTKTCASYTVENSKLKKKKKLLRSG